MDAWADEYISRLGSRREIDLNHLYLGLSIDYDLL